MVLFIVREVTGVEWRNTQPGCSCRWEQGHGVWIVFRDILPFSVETCLGIYSPRCPRESSPIRPPSHLLTQTHTHTCTHTHTPSHLLTQTHTRTNTHTHTHTHIEGGHTQVPPTPDSKSQLTCDLTT